MTMSLGEKVFWAVIALSSVGAAAFGYQRFKQIRPDLYGQPSLIGVSEAERAARIAEYQQKGDALTRAAVRTRAPRAGEACVDGVIIKAIAPEGDQPEPTRVIENGQPIRCATPSP
jgi:hypothetical protein